MENLKLPRASMVSKDDIMSISKKVLLEKLTEAVVVGDETTAKQLAIDALANGIPPIEAIVEGFSKGMTIVGERFHNFEIFLPDMMMAADAMKAGIEVLKPAISQDEMAKSRKGVVVVGTVFGDIHDIGKNLVIAMLEAAGYEVHDIGIEVAAKKFIEKAMEVKADIIGMSALLTPTMFAQKDVLELMKNMRVRDKYYVIIGGAPITPEWAKEIGADGYGKYATDAVDVCNVLMSKGKDVEKPVVKG
jgi:corrinoid protein of di/trimethylamine methyltransferase